ncbi:threonylcarbamoyl-AMP synthase [Rhodoblastus sphagnicola]|uniref:Threonylcarbamoyl-AMP synthase n=1 Tax=Rhodoblastus sphagnicola TaxID=333368 RepID=A0A2S6N7P5_9HYPH|nr:L-threonylcarbamoyladenylate synthase [Rhodoblastus sphagnicola]MBB4196727.1 L-threonylcarbamoyladenylate synthase [Rhodoblastus sphagnicola]PPQ30629.1 threonylcarbamoyl-AMP synthase [Rhodoblastus sphagnicola]
MTQQARATRRLAADASGEAQAAEILRNGGLVAFPTETVYGLGADAANPRAVAGIYEAKGRPRFNPLIAHVASVEQARREGVFSPRAEMLAEKFWPGPLTLVVPLNETASVCALARAGLQSLGLRMPAQKVALDLIAASGRPIAAPSANRSGHVSPATAEHVLADLDGRIDAVLDGGACAVGVESTIVALLDDTPRLLRPGGLAREAIDAALGCALAEAPKSESPVAPGLLASHYAPAAAVRLNALTLAPGEAGLDFGGRFAGGDNVLDLSPSRDLAEAAANLFSALRALDASGAAAIAVAPIPALGLGEAINDRLTRAAAPRP